VAFCINQFAGTTCIGLQGALGFDVLKNTRTSTADDGGVAELVQLAADNPIALLGGATFHQVLPAAQVALHSLITELQHDSATAKAVQQRTIRWLANNKRAFVTTWNCTAHDPTLTSTNSGNEAICQGNGYPSSAPTQIKRVRWAGKPTWRVGPGASALPGSRPTRQTHARHHPDNHPDGTDTTNNVVLVMEDETVEPAATVIAMLRLVQSLTIAASPLTGRRHVVVFFVKNITDPIWISIESLVHMVEIEPTIIADRFPIDAEVSPRMSPAENTSRHHHHRHPLHHDAPASVHRRNLVLAGFLLDQPINTVKLSMHCPPTTVFVRDPFTSIEIRGGIALFVTQAPNAWLTRWPPSTGLVTQVFGVCGEAEVKAKPEWIGPALVDSSVVIGMAAAHAVVLTTAIERYDWFHRRNEDGDAAANVSNNHARMCSPEQVFSRVVWDGRVAQSVPVTIYTPVQSPMVVSADQARESTVMIVRTETTKNLKKF
jgi:hypothetical protein